MKLSEPRDKAVLVELDIEEWTGLERLVFDWDEPFWILRDLPPQIIHERKRIIELLKTEFAHLEMELDNTVEISEAKNEDLNNLRTENERLRENWGKRSAKPRRLRATARHYLLALDLCDDDKRTREEKKLRQYSGYDGWPHAYVPPPSETPIADVPKIVCLCGSSRFVDIMAVVAWLLERDEGKIAMGLHLLPRWYPDVPAHHLAEAEGVAEQMDELHRRKVDLADEVFVINWHGYIGESTAKEIEYATAQNKPIRYLGQESIYLDFVKHSLLLSHLLEPTQQTEANDGSAQGG